MTGIVRTAEQIVVLEAVRQYVDSISPIDMTNPGVLAGHLMGAETLLMTVAEVFTEPATT